MSRDFLVVSTQQRRYLVALADVQEIVSLMWLAPVDGQAGACRGMANLRGRILPVFDLSGPTAPLAASRFILICDIADKLFGFIVDEVYDVLRVPADQLTEQPIGGGKTMQMTCVGDEIISVLEPADALARLL